MELMELDSYLKQCSDFLADTRLNVLINIDPSIPICLNVKTLHYRLREEKAARDGKAMEDKFDNQLGDIEFLPLDRPEIDITYPEYGKWLDAVEKEKQQKEAEAQAKKDAAAAKSKQGA